MKYKLEKNVRDTAPVRNAFNALAMQTFQLSFEGWYENGCWSQRYQPYTLMDEMCIRDSIPAQQPPCDIALLCQA